MAVLEYQKRTNRIFSEFECHCHTVYEVYYFVSGDADILIEGKVYNLKPHTLILLAPGVLHGIQVNSAVDYVRYVIYITTNDIIPERLHILTSVAPDIRKDPHKVFIYEHTEEFNLTQFFYNLNQLENQPPEIKELLEPIYLEAFVAQIHLIARTLEPSESNLTPNSKIADIVNFINLNITESLSLDLIADKFFISKNYLNRLFKQYLSTTVNEYIRYKRIIIAKQYMLQDGDSAIDAAMRVGFVDYSSFYRAYTKYLKSSPRIDMTHSHNKQ